MAQRGDSGQSFLGRHQVGRDSIHLRSLPLGGPQQEKLLRPLEPFGHNAAELTSQYRGVLPRLFRQVTCDKRQHERRGEQGTSQCQRSREGEGAYHEQRCDNGEHPARQRSEDAEVEVLQGIDVRPEPPRDIAAGVALQHSRSKRFKPLEQPDPKIGQHAQRRLMAYQALRVAPQGAQDGQGTDGRRRKEVIKGSAGGAGDGHGSDEPAGKAHEQRVGCDDEHSQDNPSRHPAPLAGGN